MDKPAGLHDKLRAEVPELEVLRQPLPCSRKICRGAHNNLLRHYAL